VGCQDGRCKATFHIACAVVEGCCGEQEQYRLWCPRHSKDMPAIRLELPDEPPSIPHNLPPHLAKLNRWREVGSPGSAVLPPAPPAAAVALPAPVKMELEPSPSRKLPPPSRTPAPVLTPHQQRLAPLAELDSHEFSPMLRELLSTPPVEVKTSPSALRAPTTVTAAAPAKPIAPSPLPIDLMKEAASPAEVSPFPSSRPFNSPLRRS
jgi:hypothetical protein